MQSDGVGEVEQVLLQREQRFGVEAGRLRRGQGGLQRERESMRRLRCAVSIWMLSVWVPKKSRRTVRSAGRGLISTVWEINCCPSPLRGSSRSEHRAKLTELS